VGFLSAARTAARQKPSPQQTRERAEAAAALRVSVARFCARVEATLAEAGAARGTWGLLVVNAETGETLYAMNPERYFTPASNTKLFTTALAMTTLGPEYRFRTTLETRGTVDRYGRLRGDLVLAGRGDPNLSSRKFPYDPKVEYEGPPEKVLAELADAIVSRGIQQIQGDIVGDDSAFLEERYLPGWTIDDMIFGFAAPVTALAVNDNTLFIEVRPGEREGEPAWFGVEPWAGYYQFQNQILTGATGSERRLWAEREPGSRRIVLRGSIPLGTEPQVLAVAIEQPADYAAALLKRLLEARAVRIYGEARARHNPEAGGEKPVVLAEHTSPPLVEAIRWLNKISQNLHAELLLRTVARERTGVGSTELGLQVAQEFFKSIGIEENDVVLFDGSGLSRRNLVTPRAVVKLLQFAAQQPWGEALASTLPVAGQDGTLADRMKNTPAAGRVRAKTGSIEHVNALSGYASTRHGARLIFSMFGNNHALRGKDATGVLDAICVAMVEELGSPPAKKTR